MKARLVACISLCFLSLYNSCLPGFARAASSGPKFVDSNPVTFANVAFSEPINDPYASVINQLYYAANGCLPDQETLFSLEDNLQSADPTGQITSIQQLLAAYNHNNSAIQKFVNSICTPTTNAASQQQFLASVYNNISGSTPQPLPQLYTRIPTNEFDPIRGRITLNILSNASPADMNALNAKIQALANDQSTKDNSTSIVDSELANIDSKSSSFINWAKEHPYYAGALMSIAVCGIVAISVAIPVGIKAAQNSRNASRNTTNINQLAVFSYLNYVKAHQTSAAPPPAASSSSGGGGYVPPGP